MSGLEPSALGEDEGARSRLRVGCQALPFDLTMLAHCLELTLKATIRLTQALLKMRCLHPFSDRSESTLKTFGRLQANYPPQGKFSLAPRLWVVSSITVVPGSIRQKLSLVHHGVASWCEWMLLQVSSSFFSCYAPGLLVRLFAQRPNAQPVRAAAVARLSALAVGMWKPAMSATA